MPSPRVWPRQCRAGEGRRAGVSLEALVAAVAVLIAFGGSIIVVSDCLREPGPRWRRSAFDTAPAGLRAVT